MTRKRQRMAVVAIAAGLLCIALAGSAVWRAEMTLRSADRAASAGDLLTVSVEPLGALPNPGFETLPAPAVFRSGIPFNGRFFLAGPAGLFAYQMDGKPAKIYRTGLDLPAAPLVALATGTLADSRAPELLIATDGAGVLAFDGQRFRQIRATDAEARHLTSLLPLTSGRLLLGTARRGVLVYDGKNLQSFHPATDHIYVTALAGDEGEVWVGTLDRGLVHWRGGHAETIGEAERLPDSRIDSIAVSGQAVYAGTPAGVAEIRDGRVSRILVPGRYARSLFADGDTLLVGQMEGGVLGITLKGEQAGPAIRRPIRSQTPEDTVRSGVTPGDAAEVVQILAVGTARYAVLGDGLLRREPDGDWRKVLSGDAALLTDRNVSALLVASDGRLWVGYFDRGLDIFPATGGRPVHIENEQVFCINRIVENSRLGAVAVATANGLVMFDRDGRKKQVLTRQSGLIANHVTDVALFRDGMVAATPAGITFLDSSGPHSMYAFQGLVNNHVYALGAGAKELLVGTLGGVSVVTDDAVKRNLTTANSNLKANWITALAPAGGDWLAGTYGAGIWRINSDGRVTATEATANDTVVNPGAMLADGRMVLAGTLGKGLLVGDAGGLRWKSVLAGLPSANVTALAIDRGTVYVGTDNGLVKITEDRL